MRIKCLFAVLLAALLSHQVCHAQIFSNAKPKASSKKKQESNLRISVWPIMFGGGTFLLFNEGLDLRSSGYSFSGGTTIQVGSGEIAFFSDILYSFRAYDGYPNDIHYNIKELSTDIAIAVALGDLYAGGYIRFPMNTVIKVDEWTLEDFGNTSTSPSFYLMGGARKRWKHVGLDGRILIGQGAGQYVSGRSLGDNLLSQISVGFMFGL